MNLVVSLLGAPPFAVGARSKSLPAPFVSSARRLPLLGHRASTRVPLEGDPHADPAAVRRALGLRWWREVLYILAFYLVYSVVRNMQGSAVGVEGPRAPRMRARSSTSSAGCTSSTSIRCRRRSSTTAASSSSGTSSTARSTSSSPSARCSGSSAASRSATRSGATRWPARPRWRSWASRSTRSCRLACCHRRSASSTRSSVYGSPWSFDSGAMHKISNQYAAMPSLHFGWSAWCALVLISTLPRTWMKALAALYPFATTFSIVVTANHYWLDAVGGAIALGDRLRPRRRHHRRAGPPPAACCGRSSPDPRAAPAVRTTSSRRR